MNTYATPSRRLAFGAALIAAALVLTACTSKADTAKNASAGPSASSVVPTATPSTALATGTTASAPPVKPVAPAGPKVKPLVHYSVAALHQCGWKVGTDGNLTISAGFRITPTGKNPPSGVPFTMTDGHVHMSAIEPVGSPFSAVLDSGKPMASSGWVGKVITLKVTIDPGESNEAHASLTLDGPGKRAGQSGGTYCPAA
jgi:hypothetical protein